MDDLDNVKQDAPDNGQPSIEETQEVNDTSKEDEELTDEQLEKEISRLKEEVNSEEDPKEKRHKEQNIGWKVKIQKERERAKDIAERNSVAEQRLIAIETKLVEEAYSKAVDDNFWLTYFEELSKSQPEIANKVAEKFGVKTADELIFNTKKKLANDWDEDLKKQIFEQEIRLTEREKIYNEIAIEQAHSMFSELQDSEKEQAKSYFDEIVEWKKLDLSKAKKYAEMAILYATKDKKIEPVKIDKEKVIAQQASTNINQKSWANIWNEVNIEWIRQQLLNSWVPQYQVDAMYPLN